MIDTIILIGNNRFLLVILFSLPWLTVNGVQEVSLGNLNTFSSNCSNRFFFINTNHEFQDIGF